MTKKMEIWRITIENIENCEKDDDTRKTQVQYGRSITARRKNSEIHNGKLTISCQILKRN